MEHLHTTSHGEGRDGRVRPPLPPTHLTCVLLAVIVLQHTTCASSYRRIMIEMWCKHSKNAIVKDALPRERAEEKIVEGTEYERKKKNRKNGSSLG